MARDSCQTETTAVFGDRSFREDLKALITEKIGPNHYGQEQGETPEVQGPQVFEDSYDRTLPCVRFGFILQEM